MKTIKLYQVDAFSDKIFYGEKTSVCFIDDYINEELMLAIANNNKTPETAFLWSKNGDLLIKCFSDAQEIMPTPNIAISVAYVLHEELNFQDNKKVSLISQYDDLKINSLITKRNQNEYIAVLPRVNFQKITNIEYNDMYDMYYYNNIYYILLNNNNHVITLKDDLDLIFFLNKNFTEKNIIFSYKSQSQEIEYLLYFNNSIDQRFKLNYLDFCILTELWQNKLSNNCFKININNSKNVLAGKVLEDKILLSGDCRLYFKGEIYL